MATLFRDALFKAAAASLSVCLAPASLSAQSSARYESRPAVKAFINEMSEKHGLNRDGLSDWFAQATRQTAVLQAIARPAETLPWHRYRRIFLTDERVRQGIAFHRRHRAALAKAQEIYGVPAAVVAAIIGVETAYGANTGRYPAFDTLTTLAFDHPPRAAFFRAELEQYLLLAREENLDILRQKGSYAAAMGIAQFIASSYRRYAIDFDGDGRRDLTTSVADAIGSVANYLKQHGWRRGEGITVAAVYRGGVLPEFLPREKKWPGRAIDDLSALGIAPARPLPPPTTAVPVKLEVENGHEYWLGLYNFYVITRYNHSALYAMAVYQLSRHIERG